MSHSYSQLNQDKHVLWVHGKKKNGFFVDVGAHDGREWSNTYILERDYDWKGICIEAHPTTYSKLIKHRNLTKTACVHAAVYNVPGREVTFVTPDKAGIHSGIDIHLTNFLSDGTKITKDASKILLKTRTLTEILNEQKAPHFIDFLSLHTVGSEFFILQGVNFRRYTFAYISLHHNFVEPQRTQIRRYLERSGYVFVRQNKSDDDYRWGEFTLPETLQPELTVLRQIYKVENYSHEDRRVKGFGDHLRGCLRMHQIAQSKNWNFEVCYCYHTLSEFLHCKCSAQPNEERKKEFKLEAVSFNIEPWIDRQPPGTLELQVWTNAFPITPISNLTKQQVLDKALCWKENTLKELDKLMNNLGLSAHKYEVIHIRNGDEFLIMKARDTVIQERVNRVTQCVKKTIPEEPEKKQRRVIISDSIDVLKGLRETLKERKDLVILDESKKIHLGKTTTTESREPLLNTLLEFLLLTRASKIHQLSIYYWGSGFSQFASMFYDVPLVQHKIPH